jgi:hypothetical protein
MDTTKNAVKRLYSFNNNKTLDLVSLDREIDNIIAAINKQDMGDSFKKNPITQKTETVQDLSKTGKPAFNKVRIGDSDKTGQYDLTLDNGKCFGNATYSEGWTGKGFYLDYGKTYPNESYFEVDSMYVRNSLRVRELLIDQVRYNAGNLIVGFGGGKIEEVNTDLDGLYIILEDPSGNGGTSLAVNDGIIIQEVDAKGATFNNSGSDNSNLVDDSKYLLKRLFYMVKKLSGRKVYLDEARGAGQALFNAPTNKAKLVAGDNVAAIFNTTNTERQNLIELNSVDKYAPNIKLRGNLSSYDNWISNTASYKVLLGKLKLVRKSPQIPTQCSQT